MDRGAYSSQGRKESDTTEVTEHILIILIQSSLLLEKEMATHSSFLPEKSHGQRSLVGYSQGGCKVLDTTEQLSRHST